MYSVAGYEECLRAAGFVDVEAEDWTGRFIEFQNQELRRLPAAGLPAADEAELRQRWQEKNARAERGEQCWGIFTARREQRGD